MRPVAQAAALVVAYCTVGASAFVTQSSSAPAIVVSSLSAASSPTRRLAPLREAVATLDGKDIDNEFTPINNYMLVKVAEAKEQSDGGIILTGKVGNTAVLNHAHTMRGLIQSRVSYLICHLSQISFFIYIYKTSAKTHKKRGQGSIRRSRPDL